MVPKQPGVSKQSRVQPKQQERSLIFSAATLLAFNLSACTTNAPNATNSSNATEASALNKVALTVTDKGCEPNQLSVPAGKTSFEITNQSSQPLEWEILDGVKVVEERENIAPGFVQDLKADLEAGEYDMGCGLRSNPKGKLTVTATGTSASAVITPSQLVAPIAEYKVYVIQEIDQLVIKNQAFTDAVIAGDITKAKDLYAPTRVHWERAEPIAELFSDLDGSMDAREDDFAKKADDPEFTGFHRIEKALFQDNTTEGMKPIAEKLMADTLDLQKRIMELAIEPKNMVGGAAALIEEVAATKVSGEEDRYSRTDLWDFNANVEGSQKIVTLLRPLVEKVNPDLQKRVDTAFAQVNTTLAKYKAPGGGFVEYDQLAKGDRDDLKAVLATLSEDLSQFRGTLGVD
ncbi:MAG: iron uptake system protein EfeO [Leptolyngbyaceae cyanobacterium CRU_2_3]|nr:iron uptake system protein EfeO [Leptolyngbyaceae cyanobacterium CRU_2_3]